MSIILGIIVLLVIGNAFPDKEIHSANYYYFWAYFPFVSFAIVAIIYAIISRFTED